tara:strand:+ start:179128 stop:179673 length:546 start_codon:yes stop_codon:yes gene_type:complete
MLDLENFEEKFAAITRSDAWQRVQASFNNAKFVFYIGNGGNLAVSSHAASDASRLTGKNVMAPEDSIALTALAGDVGFEKLYRTWLEGKARNISPEDCLVIGLSCSSASPSALGIMDALSWAAEQGMQTVIFSAGPKENLNPKTIPLIQNVNFHHTSEMLSLALSYELIRGNHFELPKIKK